MTKKIIKPGFSISFLIAIIILIILSVNSSKPILVANAAEQKTDELMTEIQYRIDESLKFEGKYTVNGRPLALSSNPYDYIKNNNEYNELVKLGNNAVEELYILQTDSEKYDSLERYIIAIAIEEITKTNLKESETYFWEDANTFSKSWNKFSNEAEKNILNILNDNTLAREEKAEKICFYGTLATDVIENLTSSNLSKIDKDAADLALSKIDNLSRSELVEFSKPD